MRSNPWKGISYGAESCSYLSFKFLTCSITHTHTHTHLYPLPWPFPKHLHFPQHFFLSLLFKSIKLCHSLSTSAILMFWRSVEYCRILNSIPGLYPLGASNSPQPTPVIIFNNVSKNFQLSLMHACS
jgi:hypothetical protein